MNRRLLAAFAWCALAALPAFAVSPAEIKKQYPDDQYLVGVGQVKTSGNSAADRRVAEVMARYEIAKQIRVRVETEMVDSMCEGKSPECKNEVRMVIKQTVDEVLTGSKIADYTEEKGMAAAVAVLPKAAADDVRRKAEESLKIRDQEIPVREPR
ncbi:MAG: LPP20 family lipoprotein [Nitrospinae bacterium]|nr:LPP20 family lipoprotein [Nitrospinota bacterium]